MGKGKRVRAARGRQQARPGPRRAPIPAAEAQEMRGTVDSLLETFGPFGAMLLGTIVSHSFEALGMREAADWAEGVRMILIPEAARLSPGQQAALGQLLSAWADEETGRPAAVPPDVPLWHDSARELLRLMRAEPRLWRVTACERIYELEAPSGRVLQLTSVPTTDADPGGLIVGLDGAEFRVIAPAALGLFAYVRELAEGQPRRTPDGGYEIRQVIDPETADSLTAGPTVSGGCYFRLSGGEPFGVAAEHLGPLLAEFVDVAGWFPDGPPREVLSDG